MAVCDGSCEPACSYGCELRKKNLSVAPSAMPTRMNRVPPARHNPAWEKGIVTDKRPGGYEMPVFSPGTREPMGVHEMSSKRRQVDAALRRHKTRDTPLPS